MTSPSCDWAYSLIPTVAVSPSFLTHSWVSANRIPLRSAIPTPFPSFRMRPLVEGQLDDLGRRGGATDVYAKTSPRLGEGRRHVRHPDVVAQGERDVSRGHRADLLTTTDDGIAVARNAAVQHLEADELPRHAVLPRPNDGVAADEVLVQFEGPLEPGLERIGVGIHVVPVEAHTRFEPQGVACAQAGRLDAVRLTFLEQRAPESHGVGITAKQLEAVFPGITGPRNHARHIRNAPLDEGIVLDLAELGSRQPLDEADRAGALDADQYPLAPDVQDGP